VFLVQGGSEEEDVDSDDDEAELELSEREQESVLKAIFKVRIALDANSDEAD
jgi:hypothetical protein